MHIFKVFYKNRVMKEKRWKKINPCAICQVVLNLVVIGGFSLGNELVFIKTNSIFGITGEEMGHFFSSQFFVKKVLKGFYQYKEICVEGNHGTKLSHAQYVKWI